MKIGMITYHRALNYGAVLQAYALQQVISGMMEKNDECLLLDYQCKKIEDMSCAVHKDKRFLKDIVKAPFRAGSLRKKSKAYRSFVGRYLNVFPLENNRPDVAESYFDRIITGSDQLWNYRVCGNDDTYFLDFVRDSSKKYSYAVSLGMKKCFLENKERILNNLKDFSCISLREPIGEEEICKVNPNIRTDVDPTLLLDAERWTSDFDLTNKIGNYILVYCVAPPKDLMSVAQKLSEKEKLPVFILTEKLSDRIKYKKCKCIFGEDPIQFLSLIKNASCVLTTSFHATVFSLKFHKRLYAETENLSGHNDRIDNLIRLTDAYECINEEFIVSGKSMSEERWQIIDKNIDSISEPSVRYLKSVISSNDC